MKLLEIKIRVGKAENRKIGKSVAENRKIDLKKVFSIFQFYV